MIRIPRILGADLHRHVGETVSIAGWAQTLRLQRAVQFVIVRDHTGAVQVTHRRDGSLLEERLEGLSVESAVRVTGRVVANPVVTLGGIELIPDEVTVESHAEAPLPIDANTGPEGRLDWRFLDVRRRPAARLVFEVQTTVEQAMRAFAYSQGCTEMHTPKLMGTASESGAEVFELGYFGRPAYLAQSPQFYKQAMVGVFERVYEVGPVFRAEPHDTARHLAQYTSLDAEFGFITDHHDVMAMLREAIAGMVAGVAANAAAEVDLLGIKLPEIPKRIPELQFTQAQELIASHAGWDPRGEPDLSPADERWLGDWALREHGSDFLFVPGFPMAKRPFYTYPDPAAPGYTRSFDLIFRGLELVTGGQRLHNHADYLAALAARGENPAQYSGYLQVFTHGMPPHGGFAIGLERWTARLTGAANVRQVTAFPRDLHRLTP